MSYYNTELWEYLHKYGLTKHYILNELNINTHNFIDIYGKLFNDFVCENCYKNFAEYVVFYAELTCNEIIIKKLLE